MRLLNTHTLQMVDFSLERRPKYAILSHTWEEDEVSFQEFHDTQSLAKSGYNKIALFCRHALKEGFEWGWVDTCCIDKTSSSELAEAINSMFAYYQDAEQCLVYLSDYTSSTVSSDEEKELQTSLKQCRWFARGWTLQELIAPQNVAFYDCKWSRFGTKSTLAHSISAVTNISIELLRFEKSLSEFSCAQKMSWAAFRQTTRPEDRAYSLLGLFQITLPSIYGEGHEAFYRLQEAIMKKWSDHSIFAWTLEGPQNFANVNESDELARFNPHCILAPSPDCFHASSTIVPYQGYLSAGSRSLSLAKRNRKPLPEKLSAAASRPFAVTNMGLQIEFTALTMGELGEGRLFKVALNCYDESDPWSGPRTICLVQDIRDLYVQRAEPYYLGNVYLSDVASSDWETMPILVQLIWLPPLDQARQRTNEMDDQVQSRKSRAVERIQAFEDEIRGKKETQERRVAAAAEEEERRVATAAEEEERRVAVAAEERKREFCTETCRNLVKAIFVMGMIILLLAVLFKYAG